jgi:hypothetical protein
MKKQGGATARFTERVVTRVSLDVFRHLQRKAERKNRPISEVSRLLFEEDMERERNTKPAAR